MVKFNSKRRCLVLLVGIVSLVQLLYKGAYGSRVIMGHSGEPQSAEVYNNYRTLAASPYFFYLKSAGLLNQSEISDYYLEDYKGPDGQFVKGKFEYDSSDVLRKAMTLKWFVSLEERNALHVYDDPQDKALASGPQVNQELCGLHLDYMLHMTRKHLVSISNSSEWSIFNIMASFEMPGFGLELGNIVFSGNYRHCLELKLNLMKTELMEVDKQAAEEYFNDRLKSTFEAPATNSNNSPGLLKTLLTYLGVFVGLLIDTRQISLDKYAGDIHALPMRYCLMGIRYPKWPNSTHHRRAFTLRAAACLPETCDSNSLQFHGGKIKKLADLKVTNLYSGYYIDQLYCLPDEKSKLRDPFNYTSTTLFIVFNIIWFSFILIATIIKCWMRLKRKKINGKSLKTIASNNNNNLWFYLSCWCLTKNVYDFWAAKRGRLEESENAKASSRNGIKGNKVSLDPLEGFKVVSSVAVITSHSCMVGYGHVWNSFYGDYLSTKSWMAMAYTLCPAVVDNFFVITGIVTARTLFQTSHRVLTAPSFWLKFIIYRYTRIIPLYLLAHWFLKSAYRFIDSGPFWDYGTSHTGWSSLCQNESFWTVILPSANFKSPAATCNGVGWYLANDIQFTLITPIFIILYLKKPILGHIAIFCAAMFAVINHVSYYYSIDTDYRGLLESSLIMLSVVTNDATEGYVYPQYRVVSYLVGLAAGYVLFEYERGKIKKWPKWLTTYGKAFVYIYIYILCITPYAISALPFDNRPLIKVIAAVFNGTTHGITSIVAAIFILLLCSGQLPAWEHLYSMSGFRPLSNVSLCTLLVHLPLLFYRSQTLTTLPELSIYQFICSLLAWIVESFILAIAIHVLYELPLRRFLVKLMINLFSSANSKPKPSTAENVLGKSKTS